MINKPVELSTLIDNYKTRADDFAKSQPLWYGQMRSEGLSQIEKLGFPTVKNEEWKYTNIIPVVGNTYKISEKAIIKEIESLNEYCSKDDINIVFANGIYSKGLSNINKLPKGAEITTLKNALENSNGKLEDLFKRHDKTRESSFIALNKAFSEDGVVIRIGEKANIAQLIHIIHVTSSPSEAILTLPRAIITMGKSSEATILESHMAFSDNMTYFSTPLTDIFLDENATLYYTKSQKESLKAYHIGNTRVLIERNANLQGFSFMVGGAITRNDLDIEINGEGANATLDGLYSVGGNQHVDNHTAVDHKVPNCTSNQLYKGILNGAARAVFNGKIFVKSIAQQTNSYQLNKNLLLGENCRVDTKPQLEIFADDVKCTHGATIGQLNEDEIFYLRSRCIPKNEAVKMLCHGFVDDIITTIKNESIQQKLHQLLIPTFEAI